MPKLKKFVVWMVSMILVLNFGFLADLIKPEKVKAAEPAGDIVISEIQTAGNTANDEFVELYNPTSSPVVMSGWRLRKKTSGDGEENLVSSLNGTVPAYGFFLITHSSYDGSVTADATYSTSKFIASDNAVLLYKDAGITLIDKVGFGSATDYEATSASNPVANGSLERQNNQDSNNNLNDFTLRTTADPQNSSSPRNPAAIDKLNDEGGTIILTWLKSANDGTGTNDVVNYNIYRRTAGGSYGILTILEEGIETYTDDTATINTSFFYKIETVQNNLSLSPSQEVGPISSRDDLAPRIDGISPQDGYYVNIDNPIISAVLTEEGSGIEENPFDEDFVLELNGQAVNCGYNMICAYDSATKIATYTPPSELAYLERLQTAKLTVSDKAGNSNSKTWQFTVDTVAPSSKAGSLASFIKTKTFSISYTATDATSGVNSVALWYHKDGGSWTNYGNFSSSPILFDTTKTGGDGKYEFYVVATDKAGNTEIKTQTAEASATIDTTAPTAPTALTATATDGYANLTWGAISDAEQYEIWRASSDFVLLATVPASQTSYTDKSVERGKTYQYKIIAVDKAGNKSETVQVSITVPKAEPVISLIPKAEAAPKAASQVTPPAEAAPQTPTSVIEEGKILGQETEEEAPRNWAPLIIIGSLIILFGAGYYGWGWYQKRTNNEGGEDRW